MGKNRTNIPRKKLIGSRFGRLTVIEQGERLDTITWVCLCDCGNKKSIRTSDLTSGKVVSCGCYSREISSKRATKHNLVNTRLYCTYNNMKSRCYRKSNKHYCIYGGRGIKICDEWLNSFKDFYDWAMDNGYREDLTIDRIDVNGDYEPSNCRWVTISEQSNNRRSCRYYTINGVTKNLQQWCNTYSVSRGKVRNFLKKGYGIEDALDQSKTEVKICQQS